MFKLTVLLGCFSLALGARMDGRIVSGQAADIKEFPFQASLRTNDRHFCGAVILNNRTILTTAECTEEKNATDLTIRVGNTDNTKGVEYLIEDIFNHPLYDPNYFTNNIAVLKTADFIEFSESVQPIEMIPQWQELAVGSEAVASGWGATYEGQKDFPNNLKSSKQTIINSDQCNEMYFWNITPDEFCASYKYEAPCKGDYGGPLVQEGKLIGLSSWAAGCGRSMFPAVYTKLSLLNEWVQDYL